MLDLKIDIKKMDNQETEQVAGGYAGEANKKVVAGLESGYLAVRSQPEFKYENEKSTRLVNGDVVYITGNYCMGTGINGAPCMYVWVFVPSTGESGYVNLGFLR